jgi:hypothetical protein
MVDIRRELKDRILKRNEVIVLVERRAVWVGDQLHFLGIVERRVEGPGVGRSRMGCEEWLPEISCGKISRKTS